MADSLNERRLTAVKKHAVAFQDAFGQPLDHFLKKDGLDWNKLLRHLEQEGYKRRITRSDKDTIRNFAGQVCGTRAEYVLNQIKNAEESIR